MDTISVAGPLASRVIRTQCPADRTLSVVGTRSAMLLMREALYGTRRFDQFAQHVGISEPMAAARLRELVADGLLTRVPYQEPGQRTRHEYELTDKGREFGPVLIALLQWGNRWASPDGAPVELVHAGCGRPVTAQIRCADDHAVELGALQLRPGPAFVAS